MATMTCVAATTALAPRTGAGSPAVHTTDHLMFVVQYGKAFQLSVAMNALYQPLREALARLPGWACATATRAGWQHLTAYLDWAGTPAWTAAIQGKTERFALRDVAIDASDLPAYANGHRLAHDGSERNFSDPDASWGHRSARITSSKGSTAVERR